jgi:hypothetical protein
MERDGLVREGFHEVSDAFVEAGKENHVIVQETDVIGPVGHIAGVCEFPETTGPKGGMLPSFGRYDVHRPVIRTGEGERVEKTMERGLAFFVPRRMGNEESHRSYQRAIRTEMKSPTAKKRSPRFT